MNKFGFTISSYTPRPLTERERLRIKRKWTRQERQSRANRNTSWMIKPWPASDWRGLHDRETAYAAANPRKPMRARQQAIWDAWLLEIRNDRDLADAKSQAENDQKISRD